MHRQICMQMLAGTFLALMISIGHAASATTIMAGNAAGRNVTFRFDRGSAHHTAALHIQTHLVGNPGAKLSIRIDHNTRRLFSRILSTDDCKYGNDGARCSFVIEGKSRTYQRFVTSFKRGRTVHVEVLNAGVMQMSEDISLIGFTRQYER